MLLGFSIKVRLLAFSLLLIFVSVAVSAIGLVALKKVSANYEQVASINFPKSMVLSEVQAEIQNTVRNLIKLSVKGIPPFEFERSSGIVDKSGKHVFTLIDQYRKFPIDSKEKEQLAELDQTWTKLSGIIQTILTDYRSGSPELFDQGVKLQLGEYDKTYHDSFRIILAMIADQKAASKAQIDEARSSASFSSWLSIAFTVGGAALGLLVGFFFAGSLSTAFQSIATGLSGAADEVAQVSGQVSESGNVLSSSANEQAAALQQTVASIEQVSAMVRKNAENARNSETVAGRGANSANHGKAVVGDMIRSIEEINRSNAEIAQQMEAGNQEMFRIVKVISEIAAKTKIINDIAFQTKLLSFNASVEAARAGEHGKGFSVVAEEVGSLAQMSASAAEEIAKMLDSSTRNVEEIVNATKDRVASLITSGKQKVEEGTRTAHQCGEVLDELVAQVNEISRQVNEISKASGEQAQGVQEITVAMNQLDQAAHRNTASAQQSANAAQTLTTQTQELRKLVVALVRSVEGDRAA